MGNASEKVLLEQVARSPAVQNIVHETAAKLARVLSASVIEMCRTILEKRIDPPPPTHRRAIRRKQQQQGDGDVHVYGSVQIIINHHPFDSQKYENEVREVVQNARRKIIDGSIAEVASKRQRSLAKNEFWEYYDEDEGDLSGQKRR
jgi:hypothetical protein